MIKKFAKLLKLVVSATKHPGLPEDHTWSQKSMATQRARGKAEADMQDTYKVTAPMETSRAQWVALQSTALATDDTALIAALAEAKQRACAAIMRMHGTAALSYPTDEQLEELHGMAFRHIPTTEVYKASAEVRETLASAGYAGLLSQQ